MSRWHAIRDEALIDQFFENVIEIPGGCWQWQGAKNPAGYGYFNMGKSRFMMAHRYAYELFNGTIPSHLEIDHLCRNHGCVNPDHLEMVTRSENVRRGRRHGSLLPDIVQAQLEYTELP